MSIVVCSLNCKHRSRYPLRRFHYKNGDRAYGCTKEAISISRQFDPDGIIEQVVGEECMTYCLDYEPVDNKEEVLDQV